MLRPVKVGIVETDVFGCLAWHAQCLEPGCGHIGKQHSGKRGLEKAQEDAKQHGEQHMLDAAENALHQTGK